MWVASPNKWMAVHRPRKETSGGRERASRMQLEASQVKLGRTRVFFDQLKGRRFSWEASPSSCIDTAQHPSEQEPLATPLLPHDNRHPSLSQR